MTTKPKGKLTHEIVWLPIDDLVDNWWNPNSETAETFNKLFESLKDLGFVETIQVVSLEEFGKEAKDDADRAKCAELLGQGKKWVVLHGSHRYEAARLAGKENISEVPCVVLNASQVAKLKAMSVRMNLIKGKIDPEKFVKLYEELGRDPEVKGQMLNDMLGIANQKELDALIKETKKSLPKEMQDELDKARQEIKTIEDLSRVLNELFSRFGKDLEYAFMTFTWGGKIHTFVQLNKDAATMLASLKEFCRQHNANMNDVLMYGWRHTLGAEHEWPQAQSQDLGIAE